MRSRSASARLVSRLVSSRVPHLRTDEEVAAGARFFDSLTRIAREAVPMIRAAWYAGRGFSRLRLSYLVFRYHFGFIAFPLRSLRTFPVRINCRQLAGGNIMTRIRATQSDLFVIQNVLLKEVYAIPQEVWEPSDVRTIVDLGANIGISAAYLSARFPGAQILCVEPVAENVEMLHMNQLGNWRVRHCAVGDHDGAVEIGVSRWWGSGSIVEHMWRARQSRSNRFEHEFAMPSRQVESRRLSTLLEEESLTSVDVLKMDIEGAEAMVFRSDTDWLRRVSILMIEIHDKYVDGRAIRHAIQQAGLTAVTEAPPGGCEIYARLN